MDIHETGGGRGTAMKEYGSFEYAGDVETDQKNPNERFALAYANIIGYAHDDEIAVICRVWMLKEMNGPRPAFLVDWHDARYSENQKIKQLIEDAKIDLERFKDVIVDKVYKKAYEQYKLEWMLEHGYTLKDLIEHLPCGKKTDKQSILEAFKQFEEHLGFDGNHCEIWDDDKTFYEREWKDQDYMREHLKGNDYSIWLSDRDWAKNRYGS